MISLRDAKITDILPESYKKDPKIQALAFVVNKYTTKILDLTRDVGVYYNIDQLSERILDVLAKEFRVQYYEDTVAVEIKRNLIKTAMGLYPQYGTTAAANDVIKSIYGDDGRIEEWFEYGGEAYHFRIRIYGRAPTKEEQDKIIKTLASVKRKSAWLDGILFFINSKTNVGVTSASSVLIRSEIRSMADDMSCHSGLTTKSKLTCTVGAKSAISVEHNLWYLDGTYSMDDTAPCMDAEVIRTEL